MAIFNFESESSIGSVFSVDTSTIIVKVEVLEKLRKLQVNHLIAVKSSKAGQHLIGIINRITRKVSDEDRKVSDELELSTFLLTENIVKVNLIGTLLDKYGKLENVFKRTLDTVPEIDAPCFPIDGENITKFMKTISTGGFGNTVHLISESAVQPFRCKMSTNFSQSIHLTDFKGFESSFIWGLHSWSAEQFQKAQRTENRVKSGF